MTARDFLKLLPEPLTDEQIDIIVRAEGLCEYCGDDLLQSVSSYCSSEFEHIDNELEQPHYDSFENKALTCSHCNKVKKDHIPPNLTREQFRELSREEKVERVAEWLKGKSKEKREHDLVESLRFLVIEKQLPRLWS